MGKIDEVIKMVKEDLFATETKDNTNYFGYVCIINKDFDREKLLEVLKYAKQIEARDTPMKPKTSKHLNAIFNYCVCDNEVMTYEDFCSECGQRLDWSKE